MIDVGAGPNVGAVVSRPVPLHGAVPTFPAAAVAVHVPGVVPLARQAKLADAPYERLDVG